MGPHLRPNVGRARLNAPRPGSHLEQLEASLAHADAERQAQASAVEEELGRLSGIYGQLKDDLVTARAERDEAREQARRERARRAHETSQLNENLRKSRETERRLVDEAASSTRAEFVRERLADTPVERRQLQPGEIPEIEGFRVQSLLGRGGMASVFRAERTRDGQEVALKILHGERAASRNRVELFLREAAMMLQLDHPGLLRALDAGECAYGPYLVLPVVSGRNLAIRVRRDGPLREVDAIRVALQMGRALRYCTRGGLIHRDVKPSNILEDTEGRLRLCDFGLAALQTGDAGRAYGSPGFASPEQLFTPHDVDERADIYGLGCTLWCLVVAQRPFDGTAKESFNAARTTDLSDPRVEGADISPRLAQVIRRMGRADRERRYRNWDECLLDLMLVEAGNPPMAAHLADAFASAREDRDDDASAPDGSSEIAPAKSDAIAKSASESDGAPPPGPYPGAMSPCFPDLAPVGASDRASEDADGSSTRDVLPAPRRTLAPQRYVVPALCLVIAMVASLIVGAEFLRETPAIVLERRARDMAAEGHTDEAVSALRRAADLLGPEDAARLLEVALELQAR